MDAGEDEKRGFDEGVVRRGPNGRFQVRKGGPGWEDPANQDAFLLTLSLTCNVTRAAAGVGLASRGAYDLRRRDTVFRERWQMALCDGVEFVRMRLIEGAMIEATVPVADDGELDRIAMRDWDPKTAARVVGMHPAAARGEPSGLGRPAPPTADDLRAIILEKLAAVRTAGGNGGEEGGGEEGGGEDGGREEGGGEAFGGGGVNGGENVNEAEGR